jgi:hypothetical protein
MVHEMGGKALRLGEISRMRAAECAFFAIFNSWDLSEAYEFAFRMMRLGTQNVLCRDGSMNAL